MAKAGLAVGRMEGRSSLWVLGAVSIGTPSCGTQAPRNVRVGSRVRENGAHTELKDLQVAV